MNLYIRFFNDETLVTNVDDAMDFLRRVTNDELDVSLYDQLTEYYNSTLPYPRRFKVRARIYFIVIKTPAETIEQFKARGAQMQAASAASKQGRTRADEQQLPFADDAEIEPVQPREPAPRTKLPFDTIQPGWYEVHITFKRVVFNESRGKNEYIDTDFAARLKAHSIKESYDKVCAYLMGRDDVDSRSQMPSIKGRNFRCRFLGMQKVGA